MSVEFLTNGHSLHEHMQRTVHISEDGICSQLSGRVGKGPDTEDMVTVAIRINIDTLQNIKVWTRTFFLIHDYVYTLQWFVWYKHDSLHGLYMNFPNEDRI